ncbi:MAG: right-handed parallel beta-helix repeat-containing protein [Myxococcota bacterium]
MHAAHPGMATREFVRPAGAATTWHQLGLDATGSPIEVGREVAMMIAWLAGLAFGSGSDPNVCDLGGPEDAGLITLNGTNYPTVGAAIGATQNGDTVFVCRGTYPVSAVVGSITVKAVDGPDLTRLDGIGLPGITLEIVGAAVIDGFQIVGGDPLEPAIIVRKSAEAQLWNNRVFGSSDRGITVENFADAILLDTEVYGNAGGGIHAFGPGLLGLSGSRVWGNFAYEGAGLWVSNDRVVVGGTVERNSGARGGGVYAADGAILLDTVITSNDASDGGNVFVGPVEAWEGEPVALVDCVVQSGFADRGGGIFVESDTNYDKEFDSAFGIDLESTDVVDNVAKREGGGIWHGGWRVLGDGKSTVSRNDAPLGGGIYLASLDWDGDSATVDNLSITDNTAENGGGVYLASTSVNAPRYGRYYDLLRDRIIGNVAAYAGGGVGMPFVGDWGPDFRSYALFQFTVLDGNTADLGGGLFAASQHISLGEGAEITGSVATIGGGMYLDRDAEVQVDAFDTFVTRVASNKADEGGGAAVVGTGATLSSYNNTDWGTGDTDNAPDDVRATGSYMYKTEFFSCTPSGCTP